ncbi:MAG: PspC domain-containing protein [Flavobacteriaceae bacterium]|nr:PspC domain-containing protein [Flavobacteriaceae bacterium]
MKKTVSINLAGIFFHIDEDAFEVLQNYLYSIKKTFADTPGHEEMMNDIEARIAELLLQKITDQKHVISTKDIEEIIGIMGNPEAYEVDDNDYEETTNQKRSKPKKLYRDTEDYFLGGVCSGIGHFISLDALWVRIIWILIAIASFGSAAIVYIVLWILVPGAQTTTQKLAMKGEPINVENIEKKVRESYEYVSDKIKNADYDKTGKQINTGLRDLGNALKRFFGGVFRVIAVLIGITMMIFTAITAISLLLFFFTAGVMDLFGLGDLEYLYAFSLGNVPIWLIALVTSLFVGLPLLAFFMLGLQLTVPQVKGFSSKTNLVLWIVWGVSFFTLLTLGLLTASNFSTEETVYHEQAYAVEASDTIIINMPNNNELNYNNNKGYPFKLYKTANQKVIISKNVRINLQKSTDSLLRIGIEKEARGKNFEQAKSTAEKIVYEYNFENNRLALNRYLTTDHENMFRDQQVLINILIPENIPFKVDASTSSRHSYKSKFFRSSAVYFDSTLKFEENDIKCITCDENDATKSKEN